MHLNYAGCQRNRKPAARPTGCCLNLSCPLSTLSLQRYHLHLSSFKCLDASFVLDCFTGERMADDKVRDEWRRERKTIEPAALMVNRASRKRTLDEFMVSRR